MIRKAIRIWVQVQIWKIEMDGKRFWKWLEKNRKK